MCIGQLWYKSDTSNGDSFLEWWLNSFGPMVSDLRPILAWSEVTGPGEASFWAHNLFETALESPAFPLSQSGLTSMLKTDQNCFSGPYFMYYLDNNSILSFFGRVLNSRASRAAILIKHTRRYAKVQPRPFRSTRRKNIKRSIIYKNFVPILRRTLSHSPEVGERPCVVKKRSSPTRKVLRRFGGNSCAWRMTHFRTRSRPCSRNQLGPKLLTSVK